MSQNPIRSIYQTLLNEVKTTIDNAFPEIKPFMVESLSAEMPFVDLASHRLPALETIEECRDHASFHTRSLVNYLIDNADFFHWQQSYSEADFGPEFLKHYAWFNLISPVGPFVCQHNRLTLGYWGAGLKYGYHRHEPEEIYAILAGHAVFKTPDKNPRLCGPGDIVRHDVWEPHATDINPGPLLALIPWRGKNLLHKPRVGLST